MNRFFTTCLSALLAASTAFAADRPRITGDEGATYEDLIREQRLVTITLKSANNAQDFNMKITGIYDARGTIAVIDQTGAFTAYKFENIRDVRVQKEAVRRGEKPDPETVLTAEDKAIVADAANRAMAIFSETHNQQLKMQAANILAASDHDHKEDALAYLKELSVTNDAATAMLAGTFLWQNGVSISAEIMSTGFNSGNRGARATAAGLAGLTDSKQFVVELRKLLGDPSIEINTQAARALGRIADLQSVPKLIETLASITEERAEAAVFALGKFREPDVTRRIEEVLEKSESLQRFRIVRALYIQGNEHARELLATEFLKLPAFDRQAALLLAQDGDPDALKFLREYMTRQWDPNADNLIFRSRAAMALYVAGDIQAKNIITDALNIKPNDIYAAGKTGDQKFKEESVRKVQDGVCIVMGNSMRRDMLPVLAGPIQNSDLGVALTACRAAVQIGNRDFGKRLKEALIGS